MSGKPRIAVILSGCGVNDGSEIHEAVLTLLAIDRQGGTALCFAPDVAQKDVIDHLTGRPAAESRNVLVESARIARGRIAPLAGFDAASLDALILPGGFGAAKNLCSFAEDGADCRLEPSVERALAAMRAAGKPIGALCIAPAILARAFKGVTVTIGDDPATIKGLEAMGAHHRITTHGEVVIDEKARIATTPCYMLDASIGQIATGADNLVRAVIKMISA